MWDFFKRNKNNSDFINRLTSDLHKMNLEELEIELYVTKNKISKKKYEYKSINFLSVFITIAIAVMTIFNTFNNKDNIIIKLNEYKLSQNEIKYKDDIKKLLEENGKVLEEIKQIALGDSVFDEVWVNVLVQAVILIIIGVSIIFWALHKRGIKIADYETRVILIEKEIKFRQTYPEMLVSEKDIDEEINLESEFNKKLLEYENRLSKEEKIKKLRILNTVIESKKQNIETPSYETNRFIWTLVLNCILVIISILTIMVEIIKEVSGEQLSRLFIFIYVTFVFTTMLYYIFKMDRVSKREDKKQKNIEKINKEGKYKIDMINIEIQVLKYLLYIEDNITIEV